MFKKIIKKLKFSFWKSENSDNVNSFKESEKSEQVGVKE